jgi:hypothetical protein
MNDTERNSVELISKPSFIFRHRYGNVSMYRSSFSETRFSVFRATKPGTHEYIESGVVSSAGLIS